MLVQAHTCIMCAVAVLSEEAVFHDMLVLKIYNRKKCMKSMDQQKCTGYWMTQVTEIVEHKTATGSDIFHILKQHSHNIMLIICVGSNIKSYILCFKHTVNIGKVTKKYKYWST